MVEAIRQNAGRHAKELSADVGYLSEENLRELRRRRIRGYIATGRQKHGQSAAARLGTVPGTLTLAMRRKLQRGGHRSRYRLRKQIVEPTFGHQILANADALSLISRSSNIMGNIVR